MLETTAAILPARDFDETVAFYARLGFRETGRWDEQQYLILVRDKVEIHFFGHKDHDPATCDHGAYIRSSDVDSFSDAASQAGLPVTGRPCFRPAEDKDWGMREAVVIDCNGNLLRIGQFLDG
ncbi:bleomycin resistance protein [Phaeobacter marinintestinus]|uniref:bleomycin resistance protein n=1 Tax=Falsiphaeobacter marinintestinus TaxID=1492905 RepID=UPI0011B6AC58|nr:VOC family protein [Phaeobacter marinintestinus]